MSQKPIAAGKSSSSLLDPEDLFQKLPLKKNNVILDAACGVGSYALAMAERLGDEATIYGADLWEEGIQELSRSASARGTTAVRPLLADLSQGLPLEARSVDLCLLATALHDLIQVEAHTGTLQEVVRVLRPGGTLAVIEFQKIAPPPGPPLAIRLSPEELQERLQPFGFSQQAVFPLEPYLYLSLHSRGG
jgi:ubiquinone/menaquinone biosynthesis C-methylase UbiE